MTAPAKSMTLILGLSLGLHFPDQPVHNKISIVLYLRRLLALFNLREIIHDFVQRASAQLLAEDLGHDPVRERFDHIRTGGNHGLRDVLADGLGAALVRRILDPVRRIGLLDQFWSVGALHPETRHDVAAWAGVRLGDVLLAALRST